MTTSELHRNDDGLGPLPATGIIDGEAGPVITALLRHPLLTVESNPDLFRLAVLHGDDIARWFKLTVGWTVHVRSTDGICRLYKRRHDPPIDRAPLLIRTEPHRRKPASTLVLTLLCLVCEQLWRHPETSFNDLQQSVVQNCASEAESGHLPPFQPVSPDGSDRRRADTHRHALADAIRLLEQWDVVSTDRAVDAAEQDSTANLAIIARRDRLLALLACPSPTLLNIDLNHPDDHVTLLCSDQDDLPDHASNNQRDLLRRHRAIRAILDDPGTPCDTDTDSGRYLASGPGRRQALAAAALAGFTCVVRRNWWTVADPSIATSDAAFPHSRTHEQQAALLLLHDIVDRDEPTSTVSLPEAHQILSTHLARRPWWAQKYQEGRGAERLAHIALTRLTQAGALTTCPDMDMTWEPTPAIFIWKVSLRQTDDATDHRQPDTVPAHNERHSDG